MELLLDSIDTMRNQQVDGNAKFVDTYIKVRGAVMNVISGVQTVSLLNKSVRTLIKIYCHCISHVTIGNTI